ncbi:MAG: 1-acyl-sn-glycerol-3-phosphate acyltransferase [bacterium]|nr:1-acyl-sn-glycerol-3-phosphate acyltransferase [bacterium]
MQRGPGPGAYGFVKVMRHPVGWLTKTFLAGEFSGREHLPDNGPYIVAANHLSLVDPVFVTLGIGKLVRFLALDDLFEQNRFLEEMIYYFGSIPISRDRPPLGAMKHALEILDEGEILGVYPEGARAAHWGERTIKRGPAWLSLATGAPIIPCALTGTEATLSPDQPRVRVPSVRLSFHPALHPGSYLDCEDPLQVMMSDWVAVLDEQLAHWHRRDKT